MQVADFGPTAAGRIIKADTGYYAFVPHDLPAPLEMDWELAEILSKADRAIAELGATAANLPNPHLLIRPFLHREAVLSSRIEGTRASLSDLFFFEAADAENAAADDADVREVANYVEAMDHGLRRLSTLPLSLRFIRELHQHLMKGVRGEHQTPGQFRRSQNWIGPGGSTLTNATYVPPPVLQMNEALGALEKFFHAPSALPPLVRLAMIHYQFEAIHPFLDGNGRVGRLLISLLTVMEGLLPEPLLYISAYFEAHRATYYDLLLAVSQKGAWKNWILFFLDGVATQANDAIARARALLEIWRQYRGQVPASRGSTSLLRLIDDLFQQPVYTVRRAQQVLGVTHRAASMNVQKLVKLGILREAEGPKHPRLYVANAILTCTDEPVARLLTRQRTTRQAARKR